MRIFIHFNQRDQAYAFHTIARYWYRTLDSVHFAGIAVEKDNPHVKFLRNQGHVPYEFIDTVDELESAKIDERVSVTDVEQWERRLYMPMMQLMVADRNLGHHYVSGGRQIKTDVMALVSHQRLQNIACGLLDHYAARLKQFAPDLILL